MRSLRALMVLGFLLLQVSVRATTRKVLFIGNSYTYTNSMPDILQAIAAARGDTLIYSMSAPGGYTFAQHCTYAPTLALINSQQWDVVVLQEQSQLPSFPPAEVDTEVYPYARTLDSLIKVNDTCTQTMFLMTWGHANGDPMNCGFYPVICTYAGAQSRLYESYMEMAQNNNALVAPVGSAFKVMMDSFASSIWLYQADSSHPVTTGSYLEACVLYNSIFHKPTRGCSYVSGLAAATATTLQRVADKVTFDSLNKWQHYGDYPNARFNRSGSGKTATLTSQNAVLAGESWNFGDGSTLATGTTVSHTYATSGNYVLTHTVSNNCFTERYTDTVHISTTQVGILDGTQELSIGCEKGGATFTDLSGMLDMIEVYSIEGRLVNRTSLKGAAHICADAGMYVYRAYPKDGGVPVSGRFVIF
jgi:hypothetical protein